MKTKAVTVLLITLVIILGIILWRRSPLSQQTVTPPTNVVVFACDADKEIQAGFSEQQVVVRLMDGAEYTLEQTISGSGARYANLDDQVVFWNKGNTATVAENGVETYSNCEAINPVQ